MTFCAPIRLLLALIWLALASSAMVADVTVDIGGDGPVMPKPAPALPEPLQEPPPTPLPSADLPLRSSRFEPNEVVRNPFWPIGFYPSHTGRKLLPTQKPLTFQVSPDTFRLTSTLTGSRPIAVINGKTYAVGEKLYLAVDKEYVMVRITAILDGAVIVTIGEGTFKISLHRRGNGETGQFTEAVDLAAGEAPAPARYGPPAPGALPGQIDPPALPLPVTAREPAEISTAGLLSGGDTRPRQHEAGGLLVPQLPLYVPKAIPMPPKAVPIASANQPDQD